MKVTVHNDVASEDLKNLTPLEAKRLAAKMEGKPAPPLTPQEREHLNAQQRLEKLKASKGKTIHTVVIGGEEWYIRENSYSGLLRLGMLTGASRGKDIAKMAILTGVCVSADSTEPYFTDELLDQFFDEPAAASLMVELVDEINRVNPGNVPKN